MTSTQTLALPQWRHGSRTPDWRLIIAAALVLHLGLLLIPLRQALPPLPPRSVTVEIQRSSPDTASARVMPEPSAQNAALAEPAPAEESSPTAHTRAEQPGPAPRQPAESVSRPSISTAYLLELAHFFDLPTRPDPQADRVPGVAVATALPDNLVRPLIPPLSNAFDGLVLPREPEVIDQWMDATGIANAVIRTPSGEILCGQLKPWDPMDPLVEHIVMYRNCGGGGQRKPSAARPFLRAD